MPPKKGAAGQEKPTLPRIGDRETNKLAPIFELAEVKALLAPDAKAGGEPFSDPDFGGGPLEMPTSIESATSEWKRAKELSVSLPPSMPFVVDPAVDPANPRALANGLRLPPNQAEAALPLLEWITSSMLLVSEHAPAIGAKDYLWQLIFPQTDAGVPLYSEKGRYVVRLFDHGRWRAIVIDDKLPCDSSGGCILPCTRAPLELWPMLLAKALLKLGSRTSAGLRPRDPSVLAALTGWLPQAVPILPPSQPEHLIWDAITCALGEGSAIVALTAVVPVSGDKGEAELAALGVRAGPLVRVVEARSVIGGNYVRLTSELMQWRGRLCDRDEASWTNELDAELGWKRRQRLRKVAAGAVLPDFWTDEKSLCEAFGELLVWRDPAAAPWGACQVHSGISYVPGHSDALLFIGENENGPVDDGRSGAVAASGVAVADGEGGTEGEEASGDRAPALRQVVIGLTVSPAGGKAEAPCWLRLQAYSPDEPAAEGTLLHLDAARMASTPVALLPGAYRVSVHSATELSMFPAFFHYTLHACAVGAGALALGDVPSVSAAHLLRKGARLSGEKAVYNAVEAGKWAVLVRAKLRLKAPPASAPALPDADERGRVPVVVELLPHDERAIEHVRLHLVDNESGDELSPTTLRAGMRCLPGAALGYSILVDTLAPVELYRASYTLDVRAPADAELTLESVLAPVDVVGCYAPSYAHTVANRFTLFRYVASGAARSHAAMRIALSDAEAEMTVTVYRVEKGQPGVDDGTQPPGTVLKQRKAVGSCILAGVPLELAEGAKGATGARVVVEVTLARQTVERLGLLREPCAPPPDPLHPLDPPPCPPPPPPLPPPPPAAPAAPAAKGAKGAATIAPPPPVDEDAVLSFRLSALSDVVVSLTVDDDRAKRLEAVKAAWEAKDAGRRARGRASRTAFLVGAGVLSTAEAARMLQGPDGDGKADKSKGGKGAAKPKEGARAAAAPKLGSRSQTPGPAAESDAESRAELWRPPTVIRATGLQSSRVLDEQAAAAARATLAERAQAAAAKREALARARAAHVGPRNELVASLAQSHADWRSAVLAKAEDFVQSWEMLRAERKPPEEEPVLKGGKRAAVAAKKKK